MKSNNKSLNNRYIQSFASKSLWIAFLLGTLFFTNCSNKKNAEGAKDQEAKVENLITLTEPQLKNANLQFCHLEQKNISTVMKINGIIDVPPQNMISVSMPLGGYLTSTKLLPGMHLKKGEVIATLEDQQYIQLQQDYLTNKSKLEYAEKEYFRQKELNQSQASSDKVFQMAESEYKLLKINLSGLAEKLKLININPITLNETNLSKSVRIYSSIDGFVSKVNVNIGKYVTPADVLFELVNPTDIHLNLKVFEKDISKLFIGQKLLAYNNSNAAKKYPCTIILISKNLTEDHSIDVHCHFENYDKTLIPGMYMNAEVDVKSDLVDALPEETIVNFEGKDYVFAQKDNLNFNFIEVKTGNKENGFIEIKNSEVIANKQIVNKGAYNLLMALKNKED